MNEENRNPNEGWYAPLATETPKAAPVRKKKKGLTPLGIVGIVFGVVLLIALSSLLFAGSGSGGESNAPQEGFGDKMPDDKADFFSQFYQQVQMDLPEINIPKASLPQSFRLRLEPAEGEEQSLQQLYSGCADSIVAITGYRDGVTGYMWGTGVILSPDGLILTNTHVIDSCDRATVTLYDDRTLDATLVGADAISDIAVLKIDAAGLPAASFGESGNLMVGDRVAAIGNPLGETFRSTLTDGIISAIERGIQYNGHSMTLLQTNTALNEGNSGGALFNMYGQVVGVTNMKMMSAYSSIEGIAFAIPSSTVRDVVNSLVQYGEVKGRPSVGITVGAIPANAAEQYELPEGLYVSEVAEGSDAEAKGIQKGDIITAVNGQKVTTTNEINDIKNTLQVGDVMVFTVWRDGETQTIEVELMDTNDVYGK